MVITPYQVLGIVPPVTMTELKTAYRKAAALHHPDLGGDVSMMIQVNDAYERCKLLLEGAETWSKHYEPKSQPQPQHQPSRANPKPQPQPDSSPQIWMEYIDDLIEIKEMNEYKKAWLIFQLFECEVKPPLEAWQYLAGKIGYKPGWGYFKFREWDAYPNRGKSSK